MDLTLTEKEEFMQEHLVVWVYYFFFLLIPLIKYIYIYTSIPIDFNKYDC